MSLVRELWLKRLNPLYRVSTTLRVSRVGSSMKIAGNTRPASAQTRLRPRKPTYPDGTLPVGPTPNRRLLSVETRPANPSPGQTEARQKKTSKMIPTPVRSVPDPTVGAYGYPPVCRPRVTDFPGYQVAPATKISRSRKHKRNNDSRH